MKQFLLLCTLSLVLVTGCGNTPEDNTITTNKISKETPTPTFVPVINQFQAVWDDISSDPLSALPQETVSYAKLFDGAIDLIVNNANRTLSSQADVLEHFDKLAHPNGVCLRGIWEIDTNNSYGGYFKNGSKALVIARASSAMSNTKRGENRAFGLGIKLFKTLDPLKLQTTPSANFFVIDDLGGTDAEYFTDVALTNEPEVSITSSVLGSLLYVNKVASAFLDADENSGIRQLYEVAFLDEANQSTVVTPHWIKIEAQAGQTAMGVDDFRDEFQLSEGEVLVFDIAVASKEVNGIKAFEKLGTITFDASVVSVGCDHRLHFHHPKWRDDLRHE